MATSKGSENTEEKTGTTNYDLGSFEGFNFRSQCAIERRLTAADVLNWDHDKLGEAEFWPAGDQAGVALLFLFRGGKTCVLPSELRTLDSLLDALGGDSDENFLKIFWALERCGNDLCDLDPTAIEDEAPYIFVGSSFIDIRKDAAYELFESYYPNEYKAWEESHCDGLIFDVDRFLDSPAWDVEEVNLADKAVLLVKAQ
jgi:hypothetical protein